MDQSQAQRRLVKSPPELWAELSSEDSLGRHLAEFGEIRITRIEPETTVAWEGDRASGTVEISPTGWGTQVTLTATAVAEPELAEPELAEPELAEPELAEPELAEPELAEPELAEPELAEPELAEPEPPPAAPPPVPVATISLRETAPPVQPVAAEPDEAPRGFFSRFFRRHAAIPPPPGPSPDPSPPTPGPDPLPPVPSPDPSPPAPGPDPTPPGPGPGPAPPQILQPAESVPTAIDTERTEAILSEVLDVLGAAHHRPFTRG